MRSNDSIGIPSVVTKMSLADGPAYTHTEPEGPGAAAPRHFTALDLRTGEVAHQQLAGVAQATEQAPDLARRPDGLPGRAAARGDTRRACRAGTEHPGPTSLPTPQASDILKA